MADFDQLIKDKVEKAEYSYKPSAWKRFAKRAGIKAGLSGLQIAAISVAVVAVITGITLGVVFSGKPVLNGEQGTVDKVQGTVEMQQDAVPIQDVQGTVDSAQGIVETQHAASQPKANSQRPTANGQQPIAKDQQSTANSQQPIANSQRPKANSQRPIYGPPVELNVDTITQMVPTDEQLRQGNSRIF